MKLFTVPKYFDHTTIEEFLKTSEPIFKMQNAQLSNVILDTRKIKDISILGLLMLYKFIDYTYVNFCFKKPEILGGATISEAWRKYEFESLIYKYISNKDITEQAYKNFKVKIDENFIIAPQPLLRNSDFSKETLRDEFIPKLNKYYENQKTVLMLFTCLSEVLLNFWEHAIDDNRSIIIADGNKRKIEIACADNGEGMITSLKQNPKYSKIHSSQLLSHAISLGVTSKEKSNHMGYGLWIINEITKMVNGRFYIYSEGFYYKNNFGKIQTGKCAFWKGTIVYLYLPLNNPVSFCDLSEKIASHKKITDIKIKFI